MRKQGNAALAELAKETGRNVRGRRPNGQRFGATPPQDSAKGRLRRARLGQSRAFEGALAVHHVPMPAHDACVGGDAALNGRQLLAAGMTGTMAAVLGDI